LLSKLHGNDNVLTFEDMMKKYDMLRTTIDFFIIFLLNKKLQNHVNGLRSRFCVFFLIKKLKKKGKKKKINSCVNSCLWVAGKISFLLL
jgi:hypothetical protein